MYHIQDIIQSPGGARLIMAINTRGRFFLTTVCKTSWNKPLALAVSKGFLPKASNHTSPPVVDIIITRKLKKPILSYSIQISCLDQMPPNYNLVGTERQA